MAGLRKQRIILTARSACAAWGIVEIWRTAAERRDADIRVVAQEPAATIFSDEGVPFTRLDMPTLLDPESADSRYVLEWTGRLLADFEPDVALVGLSAPGEGGIDEAVIREASCPTFVLQDFWGDCNLFFDCYADCYLTPDNEGSRLTTQRHGVRNFVLGSPRHARYAKFDMVALASQQKTKLGLDAGKQYYGLFCQPLFHIAGYRRTITDWAEAIRELNSVEIVYRPHPASNQAQIDAITSLLREQELEPRLAKGGPIEHALSACAVTTSALSNSNVDAAYINHFAPQPIVVPTYMIYEPDLKDYLDDFQEADAIPAVEQGLASVALSKSALKDTLASAMQPATRQAVWQSARKLPNPVEALERAVDILMRPQSYL